MMNFTTTPRQNKTPLDNSGGGFVTRSFMARTFLSFVKAPSLPPLRQG